jgi:hypothetical protein
MEAADYRPLSDKEHELLVWLLEHGPINATIFLPQLGSLRRVVVAAAGVPASSSASRWIHHSSTLRRA